MKYIKLYEGFDSYDPYELMILPPNKKAEMIIGEIKKRKPNLDLVGDLITLGAYVDWQDEENYGWTALHWAAERNRPEIARMLLDAGAKLDIQNNNGWTALHVAVMYNHTEIARMLLDAGARKDIQNENGKTPYDLAHTEEMKTILEP